ncbi:MAG: peptidoglycan-associated lipoprotein Pal [Hyphomonadaceae bacterium]
MMRSISLTALATAVVITVSACASNPPEPEPTPAPTETAVVTPPRVTPPPAPPTPPPMPPGPAAGSRADFTAKATDRVYFDYDQYNLDDEDRRALTTQITWLKQYPSTRVEVQGHADERGTQDYNIALGARRAEAVASYLKAQGIAAARIQTISFGKSKPLDPGHDEAAWARNRNAFTNVIVEAIS